MRALVIRHDHVSEPGHVGTRLVERGYDLTTVTVVPQHLHHTPRVSFDFPDAGGWDLIVSLGAPWSVYDDAIGSWIDDETALLRKAHHLGVPVLGICFGAQALASALGGSVEAAPRPEIGWMEIDTRVPSLVPCGPWLEWHYDRFALPPGAVQLARSEVGPQAFRLGRSLGVQFHPEATARMIEGWLDLGGDVHCAQQGIDPQELLSQARDLEPEARSRAARLVDAFLDHVPPTA